MTSEELEAIRLREVVANAVFESMSITDGLSRAVAKKYANAAIAAMQEAQSAELAALRVFCGEAATNPNLDRAIAAISLSLSFIGDPNSTDHNLAECVVGNETQIRDLLEWFSRLRAASGEEK